MKKMGIFVVALVLLLFLLLWGCAVPPPQQTMVPAIPEAEAPLPPAPPQGRVLFTITDAAAELGTVSEIRVTVDSVMVHGESEGWVTISEEPKTYDLLKLKTEGTSALLVDAQLKEGTYNQVRLDISKVIIVDANGEYEAKLPSHELKIQAELEIKKGTTSTSSFDFLANESLHVTGNGEYILAPVVQLETRSDANVDVRSDDDVRIREGKLNTKIKVGMDASGNVGVNARIPARAKISISGSRIIVSEETNESANVSVKVKVSGREGGGGY